MYFKTFASAALFSGIALVYGQDLSAIPACAVGSPKALIFEQSDNFIRSQVPLRKLWPMLDVLWLIPRASVPLRILKTSVTALLHSVMLKK